MFTETTSLTTSLMLTKFQTILDQKFPFLRTAELYLAISGGKDSMTLSHLLAQSGIKHTLLHCNFQLRGKESDQDELFLQEYAAKNKLQIHVQKFNTSQIADEKKLSIQECARNLRYEWFRKFIDGNSNAFLLTAHHLDDSIETFFINLLRGTGFRGLSGIPVNANQIVRPLSDFTAEEIYRYIDANQLDYRSDSSNAKRDYLRNKIRHDLIPVLAEVTPDYQAKMSAIFEEFTSLKHHVDHEVTAFNTLYRRQEKNQIRYKLEVIQKADSFFREQVLRAFGIYKKNASEFSKFLSSSTGSEFRTSDFIFYIDREDLLITEFVHKSEIHFAQIHELHDQVCLDFCGLKLERKKLFELIKNNSAIQQLDFSKIKFPITIRNWQQGDKIKPLGMSGSKLVSDVLIDKKVSMADKSNQLVIVDCNEELVCLPGLMIGEACRLTDSTNEILQIELV
jgi:tRNA(Ile)-lysidine synthase